MFVLSVSMQVSAQKGKGERGERGEKRKEMKAKGLELKEKLNLSPEQQTKIKEIRKRHHEDVKAKLLANPKATKEEKRKMMRTAMESADAEIFAILNADQQTIYKQEKEKRKAERMEKRKNKKGKDKPDSSDDKDLEDAVLETM